MLLRLLLLCICVGLGSVSAFAQGFQASLNSVFEPINQDCAGGAPAPDGSLIKIYWDSNLNGADDTDPQPPEGQEFTQVNYNQFAMNGVGQGFGPGMFASELDFTSVDGLPNNPVYYLEVCVANVHWQTDTFRLTAGYQDIFFGVGYIEWTCVNEACSGCTPPSAPTNVVASDNLCPHVLLTWNSDNVDIQFWRIRRDGALIAQFANTGVFSYADPVAPGTYNYQVRAVRVCAPGDSAFSDLVPGGLGEPGTRLVNPPTPFIDNIVGACGVNSITYHVNSILGLDSVFTYWIDGVGADSIIARRNRGTAGTQVTVNHNNPPGGVQLYYVVGWDSVCGFGAHSDTVDAQATSTPAQVTGVTVTGSTCAANCIQWNTVANADSYRVKRNTVTIRTVAHDGNPTQAFCDSTAPQGLLVAYVVQAINECGSGPDSAPPVTATRPGPPAAPTGVNATDNLCDRVTVTWNAVANADTYFVFRSGTTPPLGSVLAPTVTFDDLTATPGTVYAYTVRAANECGQSASSAANNGSRGNNQGAATVANTAPGPNWDYSVTVTTGCVSRVVFRNVCDETVGEVTAPGWSVDNAGAPDSIVYTTTSPAGAGTITGFRLVQGELDTTLCRAGIIGYSAGSSNSTVAGPAVPNDARDFFASIPTEYSISVYPNPFNPSTTLEFGLPRAGEVSIKVYDITGRLAADVVGGFHDAGWHRYTFNANDLAAGMYFARITSGSFVDVKKMMLIK